MHVARKWFVLLAEDDVRDSTKGAMMCPSPCLALSEDRPESRVTKIPDPKDPCFFSNHLGFYTAAADVFFVSGLFPFLFCFAEVIDLIIRILVYMGCSMEVGRGRPWTAVPCC